MINNLSLNDIVGVMSEQINSGGEFSFLPKGISMYPTIVKGDRVTVVKPREIKKYDICFYRRKSGEYVLHRCVGKSGDTLTMIGDNQPFPENIDASDVIAVVSEYTHNGKTVRKFDTMKIKFRYFILPIRRIVRLVKEKTLHV